MFEPVVEGAVSDSTVKSTLIVTKYDEISTWIPISRGLARQRS